MPADAPPTLDPVAARRWAGYPHLASPWLHEEVARRMAERLGWIRLPVQRWALWEPVRGGEQARALLAAQYPDAEGFDVAAHVLPAPQAIKKEVNRWWPWRSRRAAAPAATLAVSDVPEASMQLVWANMLLHQTGEPGTLLAEWRRALAADGFLMFSCLGPDTLRELRALYAELGWPAPAQDFTDMHDWGDQLVVSGFADPVMDMEHITLTFDSAERLLSELRGLGRNLHPARFGALRTPRWRERLLRELDQRLRPAAGEPLALTFEIIYGHALKPQRRPPREGLTVHRTRASLHESKEPPATP